MSPSMKRKFRQRASPTAACTCARFARLPVAKLSSPTTVWPSAQQALGEVGADEAGGAGHQPGPPPALLMSCLQRFRMFSCLLLVETSSLQRSARSGRPSRAPRSATRPLRARARPCAARASRIGERREALDQRGGVAHRKEEAVRDPDGSSPPRRRRRRARPGRPSAMASSAASENVSPRCCRAPCASQAPTKGRTSCWKPVIGTSRPCRAPRRAPRPPPRIGAVADHQRARRHAAARAAPRPRPPAAGGSSPGAAPPTCRRRSRRGRIRARARSAPRLLLRARLPVLECRRRCRSPRCCAPCSRRARPVAGAAPRRRRRAVGAPRRAAGRQSICSRSLRVAQLRGVPGGGQRRVRTRELRRASVAYSSAYWLHADDHRGPQPAHQQAPAASAPRGRGSAGMQAEHARHAAQAAPSWLGSFFTYATWHSWPRSARRLASVMVWRSAPPCTSEPVTNSELSFAFPRRNIARPA